MDRIIIRSPRQIKSPDIVSDPGPAHEVPVRLHLGVQDGLHAAGVERVGLGKVDNTQPILDISLHVLDLNKRDAFYRKYIS